MYFSDHSYWKFWKKSLLFWPSVNYLSMGNQKNGGILQTDRTLNHPEFGLSKYWKKISVTSQTSRRSSL